MISGDVWEQGVGLLAERYNRELSAGLAAVYLEQLASELDDDGFIAAVKLCIRRDEFYPTIQRLVDLGRSAQEASGSVDARRIFYAIHDNAHYDVARLCAVYDGEKIETAHGIIARRAFDAIGGNRRFLTISEREKPHAAREFVEAYTSYAEAAQHGAVYERLGPARDLPRLERRTGRTPIRGPEQLRSLIAGTPYTETPQ